MLLPLAVTVALSSAPAATSTTAVPLVEAPERMLTRERLTGNWWGLREALSRRGVVLELFYTVDVMGNAAGGIETAVDALGNLDLILDVDFGRLVGWRGARLFFYGLGTHGGNPSTRVGDVQGVNNIEAPYGWKLFELHFSQSLFDGRLNVLAGLYDTNSEFDVLPAAAFFVHSSFGFGADIGTSGINNPSSFPITSLAVRVEARPVESVFARFVVADGVPGDPDRPGQTAVRLGGGDGVLWIAEAGWLNLPSAELTESVRRRFEAPPPPDERTFGYFGKVAVGAWGYTTEFEPPEAPGRSRGTVGVYALGQQTVFRERDDPSHGLSLFVRGGLARDLGHLVRAYIGGGVVYEGLTPHRWRDRLGFGIAAADPVDTDPWEVAFELTYRIPVFPWLSLQPDVQLVLDPADAEAGEALVLGLRSLVKL